MQYFVFCIVGQISITKHKSDHAKNLISLERPVILSLLNTTEDQLS